MKVDMLRAIVRKAKRDNRLIMVHLYNWTEPFLHPRIGECIEAVREEGALVFLSSNLNIGKKIDEVADAKPDAIRISLSGFFQSSYGITHSRGDIDTVKDNMSKLAEAVRRNGNHTNLSVLFHRYVDNQDDEVLMRDYAISLGYEFEAVWAYMMPLEKCLDFAEQGAEAMSEADQAILSKLALPLDDALQISQETTLRTCKLRDRQFAIGPDGSAYVCCATYEQEPIGSFLDDEVNAIHKAKYEQDICSRCMGHGLHDLMTYASWSQYDEAAISHVRETSPAYDPPATISARPLKKLGKRVKLISKMLR